MNTPFGGNEVQAPDTLIRSEDDLLVVFATGQKPPERFGIGIEYERLPVLRETGRAVPYAPQRGASLTARRPAACIETFLQEMVTTRGWRSDKEQERIVALEKEGTRVTLEPGGQVELSGRVHRSLEEARVELDGFVREADEVAALLGIAFLGLGYHPLSDASEIGWVPKSRYRIMAPYLATRGHLAHGMMKATAGCQINLDYGSEADAMEKLRVAMGLSSIVTALCANSPLSRGQINGFLTKRSHIWMHTDPDRCGHLAFALEGDAGYAVYTSYALDVPMLFVVRDGRWIDMTGRTFRSYLQGGGGGLTPTLADWQLHLTTLFPEVRLKSYVEVRGADSGPPESILAQAALWKGLLYDDRVRRRAWDLVDGVSFEERLRFHREVVRRGLSSRLRGTSALELAQELIGLAAEGLPRAEASFLEPLSRIARVDREPPAARLRARWAGQWGRDVRRLVACLAPDPKLQPA